MPPESTGRQPQKHILLTRTFQRNLKRLRRHFSEQDVVEDVRRFVRGGLRPGETELKAQTFGDVKITVVKLRLRVTGSVGRYLLGIIGEREYLPLFIDLKTGVYGRNLSLDSRKKISSVLENAFRRVLIDYLEHTEKAPRLTRYTILPAS